VDVQKKRKRAMNEVNAARYPRMTSKDRKIAKRKRTQARERAWLEAHGISKDAA
jgi:polyisoprenoid-binding protein YceI